MKARENIKVCASRCGQGRPKNCTSWEGEKLSRRLEPIKVAIQVLRREIGRQILQYRTVYLFGFVASFQINRSSLNKTELLLEMPPETQNQPLPQCKPLWNSKTTTTSFNNLKPVFESCRLDGRKMKIKFRAFQDKPSPPCLSLSASTNQNDEITKNLIYVLF